MFAIRFRPAALAAAAATCLAAQAQPRVTLEVMPTLGGSGSLATGINDLGQISGSAVRPDGRVAAVVWQPGGALLELGALPGHLGSSASGINNLGQVTGYSDVFGDGSRYRAFLWSAATGIQALPLPAPDTGSLGFAINDSGTVAGWVRGAGNADAATWAAGANPQRLPDPYGGSGAGYARAINASGQVAGRLSTTNANTMAIRYTPGANAPLALGTLGGDSSEANAINDAGWVVGQSLDADSRVRAFLWRPGVGMQALPAAQSTLSQAMGVNGAGQIVGGFRVGAERSAMLWHSDGSGTDLTTLVGPAFRPTLARAINAHAQIAGEGTLQADGQTRGFRKIGRAHV